MTEVDVAPLTAEERDPWYPGGQRDATIWVAEYLRLYPNGCADADTMLGWFANAIETGVMFGDRAIRASGSPTDAALPGLCSACGGDGFYVTADPDEFGEPGEPYQVQCATCEATGRVPIPTRREAVLHILNDSGSFESMDVVADAILRAASGSPEPALDDAIARWLLDPPRSYHIGGDETGYVVYGYDVAMAEVRSILRDPTGEFPTYDPSPAELRVAALAPSEPTDG